MTRGGVAERLWARVEKQGPTPAHAPGLGPCWIWQGSKSGNGYGHMHAPQGEAHVFSKLTASQVVKIRELAAGGMTYTGIAKQYGVSRQTITGIVLGKGWKSV